MLNQSGRQLGDPKRISQNLGVDVETVEAAFEIEKKRGSR